MIRVQAGDTFGRWSAVALVAGGLMAGSPAHAQNAPSETELGIRLGSFVLFPTLELLAGYDSNAFGQSVNGRGSLVGIIKPSLALRSDWNNHMLNVAASGAFGLYASGGTSNYFDAAVSVDGRLDIMTNWYATGGASFERLHEAYRIAPGGFAINDDYSYFNRYSGSVGLFQRFNRLFYHATAGVAAYRFDTVPVAPGALLAGSRDRVEFTEALRLGYELFDGIDFWGQGSLNQRRYDRQVNEFGQDRDSTGWSIAGGATVDLGGISKIEGFGGYTRQSYTNLGDTSTLTFGLSGIWNPYAPLFIKPGFTRSINETGTGLYKNYVSTLFSLDATYDVRSDIKLSGGLLYGISDYQSAPGIAAPQRNDNIYRALVDVTYSFRPQFYVGTSYEFLAVRSNVAGGSSDRHIVLLKVGGRI